MTFVVNAFPISDQQNLGGFMFHIQGSGNLSGKGTMCQEVEIIEVSAFEFFRVFQPVPGNTADITAGTVFKNDLRALMGQMNDFVQLPGVKEIVPVHMWGD